MCRIVLTSLASIMISAIAFGQVMNEEVQFTSQLTTRIERISVRPHIISPELARLEVSLDVTGSPKLDEDVRIEAKVKELGTEVTAASFSNIVHSYPSQDKSGGRLSSLSFDIEMENPKLWWPSSMGKQTMYRLDLMVYFPNEGVLRTAGSAKATATFGIMEIDLLNPCDASSEMPPTVGYKVPFQVNKSKPIFIRGTAWVEPREPSNSGRSTVEKLIKKAIEAGINTFWVKDLSESNDFYKLCDKYGVLVVQELPLPNLAGFNLEDDDYLLHCKSVLRRLKDHPSVAFWAASENSGDLDVRKLERLCAQIDPGSVFLPGLSESGDVILWGVSLSPGGCDRCEFGSSEGLNISHWNAVDLISRQATVSLPNFGDLKSEIPSSLIGGKGEPDLSVQFSDGDVTDLWGSLLSKINRLSGSKALEQATFRQGSEPDYKAVRELSKIVSRYEISKKGVCGLLRSSNLLDKYVAVTRLEQAVNTQRVVESWRRQGFEGGGIFFGQLAERDVGISRSMIDWRGKPKPSYYFFKRAMRDLHICAGFRLKDSEPLTTTKSKRFNADIYVLNGTSEVRRDVVASAKVFATNMVMFAGLAEKLDVMPFSSAYAFTLKFTVSEDLQDSMVFIWLGLTDKDGNRISSNFYSLGALPATKAFPDVKVLLISDRRSEIESSLSFLEYSGIDLTYVASSEDLTKAAPVYTDYTDDFTGSDYNEYTGDLGENQNMDALDPYTRRGYEGSGAPYMYPTNDQGEYDEFGQSTVDQTSNTTQTTATRPNIEDEYDVVIIDAPACGNLDDAKVTAIKNAVEKGCGLFISGIGEKLAGTGIGSISPVELVTKGTPESPKSVSIAVPDHPVLAGLDDSYLKSLGNTDIVSLNGTNHDPLEGSGMILISAGHSIPILAESSYGKGRILAFVPGWNENTSTTFKGLYASIVAYLAKLPYPEIRRAREIQSARPYAGLNMLPEAELEAIVVDEGKETPAFGSKRKFTVEVYNHSKWLAFQIRLNVHAQFSSSSPTGNQSMKIHSIPIEADFSDNYFSLIPGEKRRVEITLPNNVAVTEGVSICTISGWNTNILKLPLKVSATKFSLIPKLSVDHQPPSQISDRLQIKFLGVTRPPQMEGGQTVSVGKYDILELSFELTPPNNRPYANPFQDVEVSATFISPSGLQGLKHPVEKSGGAFKSIPVRGFYDGNSTWRIRFAPDEVGKWLYTVTAKDETGKVEISGEFECVESKLHGFIEVDPDHPRHLRYYDGTPFLVAGGGAFSPWQTHVTGALDWEDYLESHSRNRLNNVRLYLYQEDHRGPRRKIVISVMEEGSTDRYDLTHAQRLDRFMNRARELGVTAILVFMDHWPMVHDWDKSVFNVINGGPCVKTTDLFTNRKAIEIQKKMIEYIVARWGAYDNMLAWEFWNECNIVPGADIGKNKSVMIWHREMSKFLTDIDPYGHIRFTSFCSGVTAPDWYIEPWNEIISYHHYAAYDGGDDKTVDDDLDLKLNGFRKIEKPIIIAELGYKKYAGDVSEAKKDYLRIATWSAVFQGYGFILWDDTDFRIIPDTRKYISYLMKFVDENNLYLMTPLSTYIEALNNSGLRIWLMTDESDHSRYAAYIHSFKNHNEIVKDASFAFNAVRSGRYKLKWYDPKLGDYLGENEVEVKGGLAILKIPEFKTDIALVIERQTSTELPYASDEEVK